MDARLEVGLEQQAELMLKMMATLQADSILQALTSNSSTGNLFPSPDESHCFLMTCVVLLGFAADVSSLGHSEPGLQRHRRLVTEGSSRGRIPTREQPAAAAVVHPHAERLLQQALLNAAGPPCAGEGHAAWRGRMQDDAAH